MSFEFLSMKMVPKEDAASCEYPKVMMTEVRCRWDLADGGHHTERQQFADEETALKFVCNAMQMWIWKKLKRVIDEGNSLAWIEQWAHVENYENYCMEHLCIMITENIDSLVKLMPGEMDSEYEKKLAILNDVIAAAKEYRSTLKRKRELMLPRKLAA